MAEKHRATKTKKTSKIGKREAKNFRLVNTLTFRVGKRRLRLTGKRKSKKVEYEVISSREWNKALNESLKENDELMRILARL